MKEIFKPKLLDTLKNYSGKQFSKDVLAGLIVGIVALPLAIAFAIASGVSPEKGLITAIIGGFLISVLGGSRVQIGGPTGAFIVIVYGVVQTYGVQGLIMATFMAGIMLILMGVARLGTIIKYIPHPLIIGFTSGIAVIIFSSQIKDFLGLQMGDVPVDFIQKWTAYFSHVNSINMYAVGMALATVILILVWPKINKTIPGSLVAIILTTAVVHIFNLPMETIGSRYGVISSVLPLPEIPGINFDVIQKLIQPAFTIAMLGAIESLLSAAVADGMISGNHRSNTELIGQGVANIGSALFGGIPATGAIARTAVNVKNGGRSPVAGIVHAITLFLILFLLGKWASLIPISTLAGILVIVAYHMSEWRNFKAILKGGKGDWAVMVITFLLTILVDLTVALEIGIIMAAFLFIRKMIQFSEVKNLGSEIQDRDFGYDLLDGELVLPPAVRIFEITGPLFFGAAYKLKEAMRYMDKNPKVLIIRMRHVPMMDATGLKSLQEVCDAFRKKGVQVLLSGVTEPQVKKVLEDSGLLLDLERKNVLPSLEKAIARAEELLAVPVE